MRIFAVDPSLVNLGFAYGRIIQGKLVVEKAGTFQPDKFLNQTGMFDTGDITTDRMLAVEHFLKTCIYSYYPVAISGETSFYNGCNPSTIINQSKGLGTIERVLRTYLREQSSPFELALYQPNNIKRWLGLTKDEFKDKTAIDRHILKHVEDGTITYVAERHMPENQLDHANDAVAMLYVLYRQIVIQDLIEIEEES